VGVNNPTFDQAKFDKGGADDRRFGSDKENDKERGKGKERKPKPDKLGFRKAVNVNATVATNTTSDQVPIRSQKRKAEDGQLET